MTYTKQESIYFLWVLALMVYNQRKANRIKNKICGRCCGKLENGRCCFCFEGVSNGQ